MPTAADFLLRCIRRPLVSAVAASAALAAGAASADELSDRFDLHGYGFQSYLQASGDNTFYGADRHGGFKDNFYALVGTLTLSDKSKVWGQLQASSARSDITWLFIDYQLTDALRLHAGRVKLPLGFYNEIIDVKELQVTALEPSLYQTYKTGADMVHDAYNGIGADYEHDLGGGHLRWQAWWGNIYDTDPPDDSRDRRAWGGRVTYDTPLDGLTLMTSLYRQRVELLATGERTNEDRALVSIGYLQGPWDLKAEYAWHKAALHADDPSIIGTAYYLQAGYTIDGKWTPYLRYDNLVIDRAQQSDPSYYQRTLAVGLAYKINAGVAVRLENHFNRGYALPVSTGETEAGAGTRRWNLFVASINFQF